MVWRQGSTESGRDAQESTPWRAGAALASGGEAANVVVEAWDDEIEPRKRADDVKDAVRRARMSVGPRTRHALGLLAFAAAVIMAIAGVLVAWMHVLSDPLADAHAYYDAAARLNAGQALYPPNADPNGNEIYLYPPLLAVVMRPFALLGFPAFAAMWEGVIIFSFVLLLRYLGVRRRSTWIAVGLLGIPIGWALTVAQAHVPFTLLLALGQPWSVALAANLKLTPVLIALWWLGRRDFESFFAFLAWMALLALGQLLIEPDGTIAFFGSVGVEQLGEVRNWSPFLASPALWALLVLVGSLLVLALARTRWGWPAAVALVTLSPPRLLVYMFMGLIAGLRPPRQPGPADTEDPSDVAAVYRRSVQ